VLRAYVVAKLALLLQRKFESRDESKLLLVAFGAGVRVAPRPLYFGRGLGCVLAPLSLLAICLRIAPAGVGRCSGK
jgi:hypothetical protein